MLEDHGRRTGFDDGYRDATQNKREKPTPSLGASLLLIGYLDAYTRAYHHGYAQAERDIIAVRRATITREAQTRLRQHDRDRDRIPDDRATALLRDRVAREDGQDRDR